MDKFTLLSESQLFGSVESTKLEVLKKYGSKALITDYATFLGGYNSKFYIDKATPLSEKKY